MRIAFTTVQRGLLHTLGRVGSALNRSLTHIASGKRVVQASEDGIAASRIAPIREEMLRIEARLWTLNVAGGFLNTTDTALASAQSLLTSGITEAVKGASATNAQVRNEIAVQVDGLRDQMLSLARTRYQERYIFSGTMTLTDPFDGSGTYQGDAGAMEARIDDGRSILMNVGGGEVFRGGPDPLGTLGALSAALRAGDVPAIQAAEAALRDGVDWIATARATVGGHLASIDTARLALLARQIGLADELRTLEEADIAAENTQAVRLQTAAEATMSVLAREGNRSLFDYLA